MAKRLVLLLFLLTGTGCIQASSEQPQESMAMNQYTVTTSYAQLPIVICLDDIEEETMASVLKGGTRLLLHVQNRRTSRQYSPNFQLSLLDKASAQKEFIGQFSMHADQTAAETDQPEPQRFLFDLSDSAIASAQPSSLCIELDVQRQDNPDSDAADELVVTVELKSIGG